MDDHVAIDLLGRYARDRDPEAFRELVLAYQGLVFSVARRVVRDAAASEDVVQETFVRLARAAGRVQHNLAAWLQVTAQRAALNHLQHERRLHAREHVVRQQPVADSEPHGSDQETIADLEAALANLPDAERQLIVEHYYRGRAQRDLAAELGISQPAVARRLEQAVVQLRSALVKRGIAMSLLMILLGSAQAGEVPATATARAMRIGLVGIGPARLSGTLGLFALLAVLLTGVLAWLIWRQVPAALATSGSNLAPTPETPVKTVRSSEAWDVSNATSWLIYDVLDTNGQLASTKQPIIVEPGAPWRQHLPALPHNRNLILLRSPSEDFRFQIRFRYTAIQGQAQPAFFMPIQPDESLFTEGKRTIERDSALSDATCAPTPDRWCMLTAEVRRLRDSQGKPYVNIRRFCDGQEFMSGNQPNHPTQFNVISAMSHDCEIEKPMLEPLNPAEKLF